MKLYTENKHLTGQRSKQVGVNTNVYAVLINPINVMQLVTRKSCVVIIYNQPKYTTNAMLHVRMYYVYSR